MAELLNPLALALSYQESDQRRRSLQNQDMARMATLETANRRYDMEDRQSQELMGMKGAELGQRASQFGQEMGFRREKMAADAQIAQAGQKPVIVVGPDGKLKYARPGEAIGQTAFDPRSQPKPMPWGAVNKQDELLSDLNIASGNQQDITGVLSQIQSGTLRFGVVRNRLNEAKNNLSELGMNDEESNNYANFRSSMEKLRNDSLRLNKGVQTDGDAQRAWNELFQNLNNQEVVQSRLTTIIEKNAEASRIKGNQVNQIRSEFRQQPMDTSRFMQQRPTTGDRNPGAAKPKFLGYEGQ